MSSATGSVWPRPLRGLGKAYMLKGDLPKARDCISRAVDLLASARSKVNLGHGAAHARRDHGRRRLGQRPHQSAREYFARAVSIFEQSGNDVELARTFKVFSRFLLDTEARTDEAARREALGMNTRAEAIFTRLRISQGPVGVGRARLAARMTVPQEVRPHEVAPSQGLR